MKGTALLVALVLCGASPAHAITCSEWNRLYENQKVPTVYSMIDATVAGSEGRSMRVSRGAVGRCLKRRRADIVRLLAECWPTQFLEKRTFRASVRQDFKPRHYPGGRLQPGIKPQRL